MVYQCYSAFISFDALLKHLETLPKAELEVALKQTFRLGCSFGGSTKHTTIAQLANSPEQVQSLVTLCLRR